MKALEYIYLGLGGGIVVNEIVFTQTLSPEEVALATFFFGLLVSSVADRTGQRGPAELIQALRGNGRRKRTEE